MSSRDGATSEEDERDWSDWGEDDDDAATKSLFSADILPSAQQAIAYDAREHGFDLRSFRCQVCCCGKRFLSSVRTEHLSLYPLLTHFAPGMQNHLSDYDMIRCINYIRAEVAAGHFSLAALNRQEGGAHSWQKDEYMHPAIQNDPLLFHDFDDDQQAELDK